MSWWRFDGGDRWPALFERLPRPVTVEEAEMDARWLEYQGGGIPPVAALAGRWGWLSSSGRPATKRIRNLLARKTWVDPFENEKGQMKGKSGANEGQMKGKSGASEERANPGNHAPKGNQRANEGQMKGKSGANEGQTRARVKAPARIPLPLPLPLPLHKTFIGLVDLWKRLVPGGPRPTKTTGQGKLLSARLNQHGPEQVQLVILWACYGLHKRALFLRESGAPSLTTLMRPANFESYATMAAQDMHVDDGLFDRWRVFAEAGKRPVPGSPDEPNQTSVLHPASRRVADSEEDQEELRRRFAQRAEKLAAKEEEE